MTQEKLNRACTIEQLLITLRESIDKTNNHSFNVSKDWIDSYRFCNEIKPDLENFQKEIEFTKKRYIAFLEMKINELNKEFNEL